MNEKFKNILINFSLVLGGIIIFFVLLEIGLALNISILGNEESKVIKIGDYLYYPEIGLETYANRIVNITTPEYSTVYITNSIGFRDIEHRLEKDSNVFRIVILGDSYTEADQVTLEQRFSSLLEQKLNSNPNNKNIEIITLGRNGFGTDQEYLTLKNIGYKYDPDLVILVFYKNDVRNNYAKFENAYNNMNENGNTSSNTHPFFIINKSGELEKLPFQNKIIKDNKNNTGINIFKIFRSPEFLYSKIKAFNRQKVTKGFKLNGIPIDSYIRETNYSSDWKEAWNITEALIMKINTESKENGGQFLLISIPDRAQVHKEYWNENLNTYPEMKNLEWDLDKPEKILRKFSEDNNIIYLQLLQPFRDHVNRTNEKLYGHHDGHWNAKGHYLAAELIFDKIIKEELIPMEDQKNGKTRDV